MALQSQPTLFDWPPSEPLCVVCSEPIDTRRNYADGPKHIHCMDWPTTLPVGSELERQMRYWRQALTGHMGATTGNYRDTTAMLAEHPDRSAWWDYSDPDGTLRMPYVEIWARGCPGEPKPPDRFEDRLPCRYKHLHRPDEWAVA